MDAAILFTAPARFFLQLELWMPWAQNQKLSMRAVEETIGVITKGHLGRCLFVFIVHKIAIMTDIKF